MWKSKGIRKNFEKGKCPLCKETENEIHIMLESKKTIEMRKEHIEERLLKLDSKLALVKILNTYKNIEK